MWTGKAERVDLVSVSLPESLSSPAFHVGILATTASTSGCSSALRSLYRLNGAPRYRQGKGERLHGKTDRMKAT